MIYTPEWFVEHDYKAKTKVPGLTDKDLTPDQGPESKLQSKIKSYCKGQGWPVLSFPQTPAVRKFLPPGWPDMTLILPRGRVLFLELKAAGKGLRAKQKEMRVMFMHLGHEYHTCRSYKQFFRVLPLLK